MAGLKVAVVAVAAAILLVSVAQAGFIDNLKSTKEIGEKLCRDPGVSSEEVARQFMECYDDLPGKEHFMKCQTNVFGNLYDSVENIKSNCAQRMKVPVYAACIAWEFRKAGQDMGASVEQLNACQLPLL